MNIKIRRPIVSGVFDLESGGQTLSIPYSIVVTEAADRIMEARKELIKAQGSNDMEALGKAFVTLMQAAFGDETTGKLLDFYTGEKTDYTCMVLDVTPVFQDELFPAIDAMRKRALDAKKRKRR